ncbi:hypothetical protein Tco_0071564 [Tanacetum coccineum]
METVWYIDEANKNLMDINIEALYNIPKQNQGDVNDALGIKKKAVVSEESDDEDISDLKKITALLAKSVNRKKYYAKPMNNNLRTSSASSLANKKLEYVKQEENKEDKKEDGKKHPKDIIFFRASDNVTFKSQTKPLQASQASQSSGSYSSYTTSSSKAKPTATPGLADEVIHSFLATNADDVDLIHEDLDQIDDLDLEEMDINWQIAMTIHKIKKFYIKNRKGQEWMEKCMWAFDKIKEAGRGQDFKPVRTEKEALMTIDEGQINWVEQTTDEELNHALMAFTSE